MTCPHELKGRPIAAGSKSPTIPIRELLGKLLSPLVPHLKTYVKDDRDFSRILPRTIDYEGTLLSCDVVSLYTSIPHELGIQALQFWLNKLRHLIPERFTIEFIIEATLFVLNNN